MKITLQLPQQQKIVNYNQATTSKKRTFSEATDKDMDEDTDEDTDEESEVSMQKFLCKYYTISN